MAVKQIFEEEIIVKEHEILKKPGAVLLVPTETVYGLVCNWQDDLARERIYKLKARDGKKPLAMFAASPEMAEKSGALLNDDAKLLLEKFAPGPITVIAPGSGKYPTIGVRIPDHPLVLELLKRSNMALASTSANASGMPNVLSISDALAQLDGEVDLAIDGGTLPEDAAASTVVTVCEKPCRILRQGPISECAIKNLLHQ